MISNMIFIYCFTLAVSVIVFNWGWEYINRRYVFVEINSKTYHTVTNVISKENGVICPKQILLCFIPVFGIFYSVYVCLMLWILCGVNRKTFILDTFVSYSILNKYYLTEYP